MNNIGSYLRSYASNFDWPLLFAALLIIGAGLITLFSHDSDLFYKQLLWIGVSVVAMVGISFLNLKSFLSYRWVILSIYLFSLLLLVAVYFFAPTIAHVRSWIVIGDAQIQPSEFVKVALIILFSSFFALKHIAIRGFGVIVASFVYFALPASLVLIQPDLGTVIILFGIWFGYLLISEIPFRYIGALFMLLGVLGIFGWNFALKDYQKDRVIGLFNPEKDPLGVNYSVIQSKIAIGSAGLLGKGFKQGTQLQLGFLPNAATDFAFSAYVEEWGIIAGIILILVYVFINFRILMLGLSSDNNLSKFICLGAVIMLMLHFIINLGSVLGLLSVIGVNFPLLSYGGSNLLTVIILFSIIQNITKRQRGF